MAELQSRWWLPVAGLSLALLAADITILVFKGRNAAREPSIQDVFQGETHQFSDDLGQLPSVVPPTNYVATPPENHGPQYRTADWLKAQGSLAWTLQVMSTPDEEVAKSYLAGRSDREQFAYFLNKNGESVNYIVVYGNFATMEQALGVADTTDFGLPEGVRAGPEKFASYVPYVPLIQPAIDQPPPPKYGEVPIIEAEPAAPVEEPAPTPESGADSTASPERAEPDPF